uniref:Uncharacterized protein n=1 Tax=Vitis vinifera TaxID=29760 RepID=F6H1P2_VITVI
MGKSNDETNKHMHTYAASVAEAAATAAIAAVVAVGATAFMHEH